MTAQQLVAVVDLALGGQPVWARRLTPGLPLRLLDQVGREHLLGGGSEPPRSPQDERWPPVA